MAADIGTLLFVDLLQMTAYPGSPFTGNIYRDLIMFLIVPTIFIIMVLYFMTGRVIPNRNFRIMMGVGAYLFIIASGYYPAFAYLAGPYFIFLIFILGLIGFVANHFRGGARGFSSGDRGASGVNSYEGDEYPDEKTMSDIEKKIKIYQQKVAKESSDRTRELYAHELMRLEQKKARLSHDHTNPNKYR